MYAYKTFRGRQIDLGDLTPLQLRLFLQCIEKAGGWRLLGPIRSAGLDQAIDGLTEGADPRGDFLDPSAFRNDWMGLVAHGLSEADRKAALSSSLGPILEDLEVRLGALRLGWDARSVRTDPRFFLRDVYAQTGSLKSFGDAVGLEKAQSSKLLGGILKDARGGEPGPDLIAVGKLRNALQATEHAVDFVNLAAEHATERMSWRDYRMVALGQRLLALYTSLRASGLSSDRVYRMLQPEFKARAAETRSSLQATLRGARRYQSTMGFPCSNSPIILTIDGTDLSAVEWVFIAIDLQLFEDAGGLVAVVHRSDLDKEGLKRLEVTDYGQQADAVPDGDNAYDLLYRVFDPPRLEGSEDLNALRFDREFESRIRRVRDRAARVLRCDELSPIVRPLLKRWHHAFSSKEARTGVAKVSLWLPSPTRLDLVRGIRQAAHAAATLDPKYFVDHLLEKHVDLLLKIGSSSEVYRQDLEEEIEGFVPVLAAASGECNDSEFDTLTKRCKKIIRESYKHDAAESDDCTQLRFAISRGLADAPSVNGTAKRRAKAQILSEVYWGLPPQPKLDEHILEILANGHSRIPLDSTEDYTINRGPYAESAYLVLLSVFFQELSQTPLKLKHTSWSATRDAFERGTLDFAFSNDDVMKDTSGRRLGPGPVLHYRGYEMVIRRDWLGRPELHANPLAQRMLRGERLIEADLLNRPGDAKALFDGSHIVTSGPLPSSQVGGNEVTDVGRNLSRLFASISENAGRPDVQTSPIDGRPAIQEFLIGRAQVLAGGNNEVAYLKSFPEVCTASIEYGTTDPTNVFLWSRETRQDGTALGKDAREVLSLAWGITVEVWEWISRKKIIPRVGDSELTDEWGDQLRKYVFVTLNRNFKAAPGGGAFLRSFGDLSSILHIHNEFPEELPRVWSPPNVDGVIGRIPERPQQQRRSAGGNQ